MSENHLSAAIAKARKQLAKEAERASEQYKRAVEIVEDLRACLTQDQECAKAIFVRNEQDGFKLAKRTDTDRPFAAVHPIGEGKVEIRSISNPPKMGVEADNLEKAAAALADLLIAAGVIPRKED